MEARLSWLDLKVISAVASYIGIVYRLREHQISVTRPIDPNVQTLHALAAIGNFRGGRTMTEGRLGDRITVESERTGRSAREGEIIEVLGSGEGTHFRVRWDDGHESILFPGAGAISIAPKVPSQRIQ